MARRFEIELILNDPLSVPPAVLASNGRPARRKTSMERGLFDEGIMTILEYF
jgi:hypothetical protein